MTSSCCRGADQTEAVFDAHQLNFYSHTVQQKLALKEQVITMEQSK